MSNYNYELNNHKKSDSVKWFISFLLIFVLLIGMAASLAIGLENRKGEDKENPAIEQEETVSSSQLEESSIVTDSTIEKEAVVP